MAHATDIDPSQIGGNTRFYEKEFPDLEECVVVNVKSIAEMGAYVQVRPRARIHGVHAGVFGLRWPTRELPRQLRRGNLIAYVMTLHVESMIATCECSVRVVMTDYPLHVDGRHVSRLSRGRCTR